MTFTQTPMAHLQATCGTPMCHGVLVEKSLRCMLSPSLMQIQFFLISFLHLSFMLLSLSLHFSAVPHSPFFCCVSFVFAFLPSHFHPCLFPCLPFCSIFFQMAAQELQGYPISGKKTTAGQHNACRYFFVSQQREQENNNPRLETEGWCV